MANSDIKNDIGDLLSGSWELAQCILEHLSYQEVFRAQNVCRLWSDVGARILQKRRKLHYLTVHPTGLPTTDGQMVLLNSECSSWRLFEDFFLHLVSKPRYCFVFCNDDWLHRTDVFSNHRKKGVLTKDGIKLAEFLQKSLPKTCDVCLVSAQGVVGTIEEEFQGYVVTADSLSSRSSSELSDVKEEKSDGNSCVIEVCEVDSSCNGSSSVSEKNTSGQSCVLSSVGGKTIVLKKDGLNSVVHEEKPDGDAVMECLEKLHENNTGALMDGSPVVDSDECYMPVLCCKSNKRLKMQEGLSRVPALLKSRIVGYSIEVELENTLKQSCGAVSLLLVPDHPGVKINIFTVDENRFFSDLRPNTHSDGNLIITDKEFNRMAGLSNDEDLQALLLFDSTFDEFTTAFVSAAVSRQSEKLALGGGLVEAVQSQCNKPLQQGGLAVAVSGPNVAAVSMVIPPHVNKQKTVDSYMVQLKSCGLPEEQSVAFMFCCCGRGHNWYSRTGTDTSSYYNVETRAFRHHFPNTPIFGFFGEGEVGLNFLPKFAERGKERDEYKRKSRGKKTFHQYTTVIVLLSFL